MSRAEEAALKALPNYPPETYADEDEYIEVESARSVHRTFYRKGYEQAEKDYIELAQLWVDSGDANIMSFKKFLKCHETQSNK